MGAKLSSCFNHRGSLTQQAHQPAPVRVVAADGTLKELPASPRVAVSDLLGADAAFFFVCNSDDLYFNEPPPALSPGELLRSGELYFLLPAALLARPLSSADMASLAVRASVALATKRPQRVGGKNNKVRVMPVLEELEDGKDVLFNEKLNERTLGEYGLSISPAKKSQEKLAARSRLKRALSIIQEMAE
ncbi:uncharacterized protein LOC124689859 [Lolium rigidum]|uniref:uncharacterized protein LOC124689859 n=1 Tax=Lolium rigidum TaxID=89674 RepID=UPI001F5CF559|nr:uncharacterized protein LOC124689859 [Lolium rigidum]